MAAVQDVIAFMSYTNQQNFPAAWNESTERLGSPPPSPQFTGYVTSRFYQVAFGRESQLAGDLVPLGRAGSDGRPTLNPLAERTAG